MLRARLPPCDFATHSLAVQVVRQIRKPALVGALTHPTRVILRLERLNFLSVIQQNVGGALPGIGAMANYGGMRYTNAVFVEDEENLPKGWLPHATERHGFAQGANSISLMFANGATNIRRRGAKK